MYNDNLIIDLEKKIKIPQNDENYLVIEKCEFIKNSIEISVNPFTEINNLNLYITIKSYSNNLIYIPQSILILIKGQDDDYRERIVSNINIYEFKKIKYYPFCDWLDNIVKENWKYIKNEKNFSFIFTYPFEVFDRSLIDFIKPKYPWKMEIIKNLKTLINEDNNFIGLIEEKNKIIENQKKKIIELENKINDPDYKND